MDSLKILSHFLRNLDKSLKIISNRKNDKLSSSIKSNVKQCCDKLNEKSNLTSLSKSSKDLLKPDNAAKQLENIQLVLFCLIKYVDHLIRVNSPSNAKDLVRNIERFQSDIATKSKEFLNQNLDKNLKSFVSQIPLAFERKKIDYEEIELKDQWIKEETRKDDRREEKLLRENVINDDRRDEKLFREKLIKDELRKDESKKEKLREEEELKEHHFESTSKFQKHHNYKLAEQKLSERSKASKVPATRLGRIVSYGELAAGLGLGTIVELSKRQFGLVQDSNSSPLFTEANANRIVRTLCKVRGAALKIGQILSIQDIISPELARIFERVRQSADYMPESQLRKILNQQLGTEWKSHFKEFDLKPFAAASIGQVHRAVLNDGREVALKIQYPGVAEGIDSDIKNLVSLLKIWNVIPPGLFIDSIIKVTRKELSWELDYDREIEMCKRYSEFVKKYLNDENLKVPEVIDNLCTNKVITSEMVYGIPVDKLNLDELDEEIINNVARRLLRLLLYEIFIFKFMQTDPNWSNFFYNPNTDQISLIDFGAARTFSSEFVNKYYRVLKAAAHKNRDEILQHSINIGFLTGHENKQMIEAHIDSVLILGKVFEHDAIYDFGEQDISKRIHQTVPVMIENRLIPPPDEIYSLHRKLSGVFMLLVKLKAKVNCRELFNTVADYYERTEGFK